MNGLLGIFVSERFDQLTDRHLDTKFLTQFARQAFFERFIRFAFAAGEFPQTAKVSIDVALSDQ